MCYFSFKAHAQLGFCSGNSGTPIFTDDFNVGTTSTQLPAGTTTYTFNPNDPFDGQYKVSSNTNSFGWFNINDHTPNDTNGKMLIINADFTAGEFYRRTISGLCENTSYEFSSWMINLSPSFDCGGSPIPINVRFEIWDITDTNLLASGDTGNINGSSSPNWQQYALVFQTVIGQSSVILKMRNNGVGGCGNDLALDDIVFKTCGDLVTVNDTANNKSVNICSFETPYTTTLTAFPDYSVFSTHFYQWQESINGGVWVDILGETNQSISLTGISNTMYYRAKISESIINVNNTSCNTLSDIFEIKVNTPISPSFSQVPSICNGENLSPLPITSNEGITGTWSPALDNTTTTTYTFLTDIGQCATNQTMTINVKPIVTPTFSQVSDICNGENLLPLPTMSNEGITGTWSPALDNTMTTTYTFLPNSGQCAINQTMTITVNPIVTPTFNQVSDICNGDTLLPLPTISNEGITGNWSPVLNNTMTTTYTFLPDMGQCATNQTMTITVNSIVTPTFNQISAICNGDALSPLPTTSNEGVKGNWSPIIDNTKTTTYTFIPDTDQCATNQTMTIIVNQNVTPTFNQVLPICSGDILMPLPPASNEGVTGTWSPSLNNTATTTYTFTPDPGFCPIPVNMTIEVYENPIISFQNDYLLCFDIKGIIVTPIVLDTGLSDNVYNFIWELDGVQIAGASQPHYVPMVEGNYKVTVQNAITMCESDMAIIVTALYEPDFVADVVTDAFSENPMIEINVTSVGEFEYQLDGGSWQEQPVFSNVPVGEHVINVRDKRGCIEANQTLVVMGYPKYFTPNGDGFNDTWNIIAPKSPVNYLASARVRIFDRYGKLLKQLDPKGIGWKGVYNGVNLPSDDYWFVVDYLEPNSNEKASFRAHFTLKR